MEHLLAKHTYDAPGSEVISRTLKEIPESTSLPKKQTIQVAIREEIIYPCNFCGSSFKQACFLKKHLEKIHNAEYSMNFDKFIY